MTGYTAPGESIAYLYDLNSNRTQQTLSSGGTTNTTNYTIDTNSNRLLDILDATTSTTTAIQYDANGNTIDNGQHSFQYDSRNRLLTVDDGHKATYQYNGLSQRIRKEVIGNPADVNGDGVINHLDITATNGPNAVPVDCNSDGNPANTDNGNGKSQGNGNAKGQDTSCIGKQIGNNPNSPNTQTGSGGSAGNNGNKVSYFIYDEAGRLLAEHDDTGAPIYETVYLYSIPVAVIQQGVVYTVHTDQLDTPRAISNPQGVTVWRWEGEPFGNTLPNEDPDGDGIKFVYNGRFAGQYYDGETGFDYNYYRYYDPATGRYISSDPVGFLGGLNTYGYVRGNPLFFVDPKGLKVWLAEKGIDKDPTGIGGHTWLIIQPDNINEFEALGYHLPLDKNGRFALRAGPSSADLAEARLMATVNGDSTTEWRQRYLVDPPNYQQCGSVSDDTRFILDILEAFRSYPLRSEKYDAYAEESYNSNSFTAGLLKAAGVENIPDPWLYQPGLDKPVPLNQ